MLPQSLLDGITADDRAASRFSKVECVLPAFDASSYYKQVAAAKYFACLLPLRHHIKAITDYYFASVVGAKNIDLFMLTSSISSPMGPGSDSEPVPIQFGDLHTYLVDSAQFGFEPIIMNGLDCLYCYLPSMRGEMPDNRHLNQFYHCEYETAGTLEEVMSVIEGYVRSLAECLQSMPQTVDRLSTDSQATQAALTRILDARSFRRVTFSEGIGILEKNSASHLVRYTDHGRDISAAGENMLMNILEAAEPIWLTHYDRDRVPFYQKPDPLDSSTVLNADLLFPASKDGSFGGEIVGAGQRQDDAEEMYESMRRQGVSAAPYEWYVNLRTMPSYRTTAGFGLGIERFIAWSLGLGNIRDAIPYPRLRNVLTIP